MDRSRLEIFPKIWLDYRRAIYLEAHQVLAVADLHLGYTWAHRFQGQLLPFGGGDRLIERVNDLCSFYQPRVFAILGDIVHQTVPVAEFRLEFEELVRALTARCETRLILGNHDRHLRELALPGVEFASSLHRGELFLAHGNESLPEGGYEMAIIGHEHPAISLGDGILGARFPCFLVSSKLIVLPAFSLWAAGSDVRVQPPSSPAVRSTRFERAVAICGEKLLALPLV